MKTLNVILRCAGITLLLLVSYGCAPARSINLAEDMTPGDMGHFFERGYDSVSGFYPFPFVIRDRDGELEVLNKTIVGYHFEDKNFLWPLASARFETADFDGKGKSIRYDDRFYMLLGIITIASGHHQATQNSEVATSYFSLLWGFLEYKRTVHGRAFRLLWLPLVSDRGGAKEQEASDG